MATTIRILSENLTNKIAAGEVVERPSSVVKELVENALDAGSKEILVEIEAGGKRLIRVTDDGSGMSREDALLCLERHATSKIASDADLFSLNTLGFRGEALPSIASVSRLMIQTRAKNTVEGTELYLEGGRIKEVRTCGMASGTVITVRNLFFNTPARLKFLKSSETETGHVGDLMTRLALSRPDVRFAFHSDGRVVFRTLDADLKERVAALLGRSISRSLHDLSYGSHGLNITGLVAAPECSRSSGSYLFTYINGRFIRDKVVQHAVLQAYRNFLERGRYPVVALFIEISPEEVDVNVHPTKHEVRFREQGRVHDAIQAAVEDVLKRTPWLQDRSKRLLSLPALAMRQPTEQAPTPAIPIAATKVAVVTELLCEYYPKPLSGGQAAFSPPSPSKTVETSDKSRPRSMPVQSGVVAIPEEQVATPGFFSSLSVIGQYNASYIICQEGTDLVLIDQHAAHERVAFERLKAEFSDSMIQSQGLLFPEPVDLSFREAATLREYREEIERFGFSVEEFGGATWVLKSVPQIIANEDCRKILKDMLEEFSTLSKSRVFVAVHEEILTRIACHSVIRGHRLLTAEEITALLASMDNTDFSTNCPHGRPVLQRLTLSEVEKMFKRG